jgi:hypothetical protein
VIRNDANQNFLSFITFFNSIFSILLIFLIIARSLQQQDEEEEDDEEECTVVHRCVTKHLCFYNWIGLFYKPITTLSLINNKITL